MVSPPTVNAQITDAASPPTTVNPQITDAVATSFGESMERAVTQALGLAMNNAVLATQQLYVLGQAALTQALTVRLETIAEAGPTPEKSEVEAAIRAAAPASGDLSTAEGGGATGTTRDGPELAVRWSSAFAASLTLINAAVTQQMSNIVGVVLKAQVNTSSPLSPADAMLLEEILQGDAVAETIATLKAVKAPV